MDLKEKNQQFLSWFWDLASDDRERRLAAANGILSHVENAVKVQKGMNDEGNMVIDLDYALKRLVRGLSSSRDSARHGFATCLSALLSSGAISLNIALPIVDESTRIRGKIKGSEERDLMFGKLFAYLSIARSGILAKDPVAGLDIFKRLLELHKMRGWLREVVSESLLVVLSSINPAADIDVLGTGTQNVIEAALEALAQEDLLRGEFSEWSPWQLQLALGLQQFAAEFKGGDEEDTEQVAPAYHKSIRKRIFRILPVKKVDTPELILGPLVPVLIASAAGFPKIHRVWELLLRAVFGAENAAEGRRLPMTRAVSLSRRQETLLHTLVSFIEKHLLVPSHEKRSLAFRLTVLLAKYTPADLLPRALSKSVLRGLVAARVNRKHTLYSLAGTAIHDLVSVVVPWEESSGQWLVNQAQSDSDSRSRVALASVLVSHTSANFDSLTGIPAVSTLLQGLKEDDVMGHIKALVRIVASATDIPDAEPVEAADVDEEHEGTQNSGSSAAAALEAIASLAKNARLTCRGTVCSVAVAVFTRIACFEDASLPADLGTDADDTTESSKSKKSKGKKAASFASVFRSSVDTAESKVSGHMLDALVVVSAAGTGGTSYPGAVIASASGKLLTLLADAGHISTYQLNTGVQLNAEKEKDVESGPSVLAQATAVAALLAASGIAVRTSNDSNSEVENETNAEAPKPQFAFNAAYSALQSIAESSQRGPLSGALCSLIGHACFQMLAANSELTQAVIDIATIAPALVSASGMSNGQEADDDEGGLDGQLGTLLDACFELVAQNESAVRADSLSVKGVSAAIKRVWTHIGRDLPIGLGLLENMVSAVIGEDGEDETEDEAGEDVSEGSDDEEGKDSDGNDDKDGEDEEEEKEKSMSQKNKRAKNVKSKSASEASEEDVVINEEAALDLLATEKSDDEEELAHLQEMLPVAEHGEEADAALVNMLEMRAANRKAGLLEAKRKQLLVRSRAIDILEAVLTRVEAPELLMPLLSPLMLCLRRIQAGLTQNLAEGRAFESRLRGFLDQRICRKHFVLSHFGDKETEEGIYDMVTSLSAQIRIDLQSPYPSLRQMASVALLSLSRSTIGGDCVNAKQAIGQFIMQLLESYFKHKKSRLTAAIFEEHFNRFPDFFVPHCIRALGVGCSSATSTFLRAEACRILQLIVRRFNTLAEATRADVRQAVPSLLRHLAVALTQSTDNPAVDVNAKRVKPILQCLRDICLLPICVGKISELDLGSRADEVDVGGKKKGKSKNNSKEQDVSVSNTLQTLQSAAASLSQKQPNLAALVQQAQAAMSGVNDGSKSSVAGAQKTEKSSQGSKRKAGDALEAAEQSLVAQSEAETQRAEIASNSSAKRSSKPWYEGESQTQLATEVMSKKSKRGSK